MPLFVAYQTIYSNALTVRPESDVDFSERAAIRTSPSVRWFCQGIEAQNYDDAIGAAARCKLRGLGEITYGGRAAQQKRRPE